jgi:hypothetical protein
MGLVTAQPYKIRLWDEVALSSHRTSPEVAKQIALAQKTFASQLTEYRFVNWSRLLYADMSIRCSILSRDMITTAASYVRVRTSVSPHLDILPLRSTSPD